MHSFEKLAIFFLPEPGALADFGAAWSGWDPVTGETLPPLAVPGLPPAFSEPGEALGNFGLHGSVKPPFALLEGIDRATLTAAIDGLATRIAPVELSCLRLVRERGMLALAPQREEIAVGLLAARISRDLDHFRSPLSVDDMIRRHAMRLSGSQRTLLSQWGYPFPEGAEDGFRLYLTHAMPEDLCDTVEAVLAPMLAPLLPRPLRVAQLALCGEGPDGRFRLIRKFPLRG